MVNWTPENEGKLLLAIFQTQKIDKKALLDVCQVEIDPSLNEKALANKIMRMKQAAEKKTGSPLKKTVGPDSSPKPASPMSGKKNARGTKTMNKAVKKRKADIEINGYNADESDSGVESPIKKVKVEPAAWDSEEEQVSS